MVINAGRGIQKSMCILVHSTGVKSMDLQARVLELES